MSLPRALVVLNPTARRGRAGALFEGVRAELGRRLDVRVVGEAGEVGAALADGVRVIVAAGGDGTVNAVVNAIVRDRGAVPLEEITLGAIGLGSSNDFHKPYGARIAGVPVRLDVAGARPRDLGLARWEIGERVFAASASVGVTAAANGRFNREDAALRVLKRTWVAAAIGWAAVRTIASWRNVPARIEIGGERVDVALTNLSVTKTPWLSGGFRYDLPIGPDDGRFAVALCEGMSRGRTLRTLAALSRGRFTGLPGTRSWSAPSLSLRLDAPGDLELDGEVFTAREVRFDVLPGRIRLCA